MFAALAREVERRTFRLFGRVKSAVDLGVISGATVEISGASRETDSNGDYELALTPGTYDVTISAASYITSHVTVSLVDHTPFDVYLSPLLESDSWRIVLTWNAEPWDIDSHLVFVGDEDACTEMFWDNPRQDCGGVTASLDVDDRDGEGPETTSLLHLDSCNAGFFTSWFSRRSCSRWVFRVKHYTAVYEAAYGSDFMPNLHGWEASGAVVTLYNGDHEYGTYEVKDARGGVGGSGVGGYTNSDGIGGSDDFFWDVFAITSEGTVETCTDYLCPAENRD